MVIFEYVTEPRSDSDSVVRVILRAEGGVGNGHGRKGDVVF